MEHGPSIHFRIDGSRPFIRLSIKVKVKDFWEDGRNLLTEDPEKLVTFRKIVGKFSETFRKNLKR